MPPKTTLVAITGATLGQVSMLEAEMCANQSVVGVYDENGSHGEWIYRTFVDRIDGVVQSASGGAQQHINKDIIEGVVIAKPPERVLAEFTEAAEPFGDAIATLLRSDRRLEAIRDLLLPKLVTGGIDVSKLDLDALLEESAA
jgi:type I restriction enzyme, S subunit